MLTILFDFRGTINRKQYLNGMTVVLFATLVAVFFVVLEGMLMIPLSTRDSMVVVKWSMAYGHLVYHYQPVLIPLGFIVFYSSLVLSLKRVRAFGWNSAWGVLSGLITFLAFRSFLNLPYIATLSKAHEARLAKDFPVLLIISAVFLLLGLAVVIGLSMKRSASRAAEEEEVFSLFSARGKLDEYDFTTHMGWLLIWYLLIAVVSPMIGFLTAFNRWQPMVLTYLFVGLNSVFGLAIGILYLFAGMKRLRSIGLQGRWFPIALLIIHLVLAVPVAILLTTESARLMFGMSYLSLLIVNILCGLQFSLFFIPKDLLKPALRSIQTE